MRSWFYTLRRHRRDLTKWLTPGLRIKRWLLLLLIGITMLALGIAQFLAITYRSHELPRLLEFVLLGFMPPWARIIISAVLGPVAILAAVYELNQSILAPFTTQGRKPLIDVMYDHSRRQHGLKVVAIGGGTGLPSVLRGLKAYTNHITAIVTVADDGGSSGQLRREMGIIPPGDLRNNLAALANDEDLMTQLFQYRFANGGLGGHSFGNLFLSAMAEITGSMDQAIAETRRVLAVQGRVIPSTLQDNVNLIAEVRDAENNRLKRVIGESQIPQSGGKIERVFLHPDPVRAYPEAVRAILNAELIVIGPGSLFTSIIPNLLVSGISEALRASTACKIYVCNVATQTGETDGFNVADHIMALEAHIGSEVFGVVIANSNYPRRNAGENTHYVAPAPKSDPVYQRYQIEMTDLTDRDQPWRHDPTKLAKALLAVYDKSPTATTAVRSD